MANPFYDEEYDPWRPEPDPEADAAAPAVEKEGPPPEPSYNYLKDADYLAYRLFQLGLSRAVPPAGMVLDYLGPDMQPAHPFLKQLDSGFNYLNLLRGLQGILRTKPGKVPWKKQDRLERPDQGTYWQDKKVPQPGGPSGTGMTPDEFYDWYWRQRGQFEGKPHLWDTEPTTPYEPIPHQRQQRYSAPRPRQSDEELLDEWLKKMQRDTGTDDTGPFKLPPLPGD